MYQNSVYGVAACLPMKYTNAVVLGSVSLEYVNIVVQKLTFLLKKTIAFKDTNNCEH